MNSEECSSLSAVKKFFITNSSQHIAEQDRKILHEELRQQQEFREVHQQDLMKHLELQKFQNLKIRKLLWIYLEDFKNYRMK